MNVLAKDGAGYVGSGDGTGRTRMGTMDVLEREVRYGSTMTCETEGAPQ